MAEVTAESEPDTASLQAQIATLTEQLTAANAALEAAKKGGGDADLRKLKSELRTAKAELASVTTERDTFKGRVAELESTVTETTTKSLLKEHGIDPDDLDYVMTRYGKVEADEDGHKPDLGEFLTEAKAGKASWYAKIAAAPTASAAPATVAKPATVAAPAKVDPAVAAAPVVAPAAEVSAPAVAAPVATSPDAAAAKTTVTTKAGSGALSAEQIRALSPAEYKAHRAAIRQSIGLPVATS